MDKIVDVAWQPLDFETVVNSTNKIHADTGYMSYVDILHFSRSSIHIQDIFYDQVLHDLF